MVVRKISQKVRGHYLRSCLQKKKYSFWGAFINVLEFFIKLEFISFYKCQFGNHYHVGHTNSFIKRMVKNFNKYVKLTLLYKEK